MSYPINFLSLQKAELEYEVELRGGSSDTVRELRKQIVKLALISPSENILESHLDPEDDLVGVEASLLVSQQNLKLLKTKFEKNLFLRTENLLNHIYHRLTRINKTQEVTELYKSCVTNFNSLYKEICNLKPATAAPSANPVQAVTEVEENVSPIVVTCDRNFANDLHKLKFNGKSCVRSFIQKVDELVLSRGVGHDKIFKAGFDIFTDDALHWFRSVKNKVSSWQELVPLLKTAFGVFDFDYKFLSEIRARTQGESENITIYLAIMDGMFSRLSRKPSEEEKLEIILHNVRPRYATILAAASPILSIDVLGNVCRNYDNINCQFSDFHEPAAASSHTLAPEFSYKHSVATSYKSHKPLYNTAQNAHKSVAAVTTETKTNSFNVFCPRCRTNTHNLYNCKQPRDTLVCFKCGEKGVKTPDCPKCSKNNKQKN